MKTIKILVEGFFICTIDIARRIINCIKIWVNMGDVKVLTAKEFLQQYRDAEDSINAKLDQIHKLRELATKTTQTLIPDHIQSSGEQDKVSAIVSKIVDMEHEVDIEIDQLRGIKQQVQNRIAMVPDAKQRAVLTRRYINGYTWERIAVDLNVSYQWVCELHGRALQIILVQLIEVDT